MAFKSLLVQRIDHYSIPNRFRPYEINRGRKLNENKQINFVFSPRENKLVVVYKNDIYITISYKNNRIESKCSCGNSDCEHLISAVYYIKEHMEEVDEMCCIVDNYYNLSNMNISEMIEYLSRIIGPHYFLINELEEEYECNTSKAIRNIFTNQIKSMDVFTLLVILCKTVSNSQRIDSHYKILELLKYISSLPDDLKDKGFIYVFSNDCIFNIINNLQKTDERFSKNDFYGVINLIENECEKRDNLEAKSKIQVVKANFLLLNDKNEFIEYSKTNLFNIDVKKKYIDYLMMRKEYQEVVDIYEGETDEDIKEKYYLALCDLDGNIDTFDKIMREYPNPNIVKKYYEKGIIKDKEEVYKYLYGLGLSQRASIMLVLGDYEKLFYICREYSFECVMDYSKDFYENIPGIFIPYIEDIFERNLKRGTSFKIIAKYLKKICTYKFGNYYVYNMLPRFYDIVSSYEWGSLNAFRRDIKI